MSTYNICFCGEIRKILSGYPLLSRAMMTLIMLTGLLNSNPTRFGFFFFFVVVFFILLHHFSFSCSIFSVSALSFSFSFTPLSLIQECQFDQSLGGQSLPRKTLNPNTTHFSSFCTTLFPAPFSLFLLCYFLFPSSHFRRIERMRTSIGQPLGGPSLPRKSVVR